MSRKHSQTSRAVEPPGADDLQLITGIGPAVETRLHGVGIYTFARLAAMSPADLAAAVADLTGLTAERIIKQDWIGQAHKLAAQSTLSQPEWIEHARELAATGTITTQTEHAQKELTLADIKAAEPTQPAAEEAEGEIASAIPEAVGFASAFGAKKDLLNVLHSSIIEAIAVGTESPRSLLPSTQPFDVCLTLDFSDVAVPDYAQLNYTTSFRAKKLGDHTCQPLGEAQGSIIPADKASITVEGTTLAQGIYRLEAAVTLTLRDEETSSQSDITALMKGGILQVY